MPSTNRLLAEGIGTFWVVFAGCGSAVLGLPFLSSALGSSGSRSRSA
jgi:glycerol uptake facilitator-like aquaporin